MSNAHKWGRPKPGPVGPTATLSLEQQQILAAVPRYKQAWVRPSSLKPGQNPNFKILKWVIDTDLDKSEGTEEEMREALEQVAAGNVPLPSAAAPGEVVQAGGGGSGPGGGATSAGDSSVPASAIPSTAGTGAAPTPTPTTGTPASTPAPAAAAPAPPLPPPSSSTIAAVPASTLAAAPNPVARAQGTDPAKPADGPAPDGTAPTVRDAVKGLGEVEMALDPSAGDASAVPAEVRSLVQEDQVAPQP